MSLIDSMAGQSGTDGGLRQTFRPLDVHPRVLRLASRDLGHQARCVKDDVAPRDQRALRRLFGDVADEQLGSSLLEPSRSVRRPYQGAHAVTLGNETLREARTQETTCSRKRDSHRHVGFLDHASARPRATNPTE